MKNKYEIVDGGIAIHLISSKYGELKTLIDGVDLDIVSSFQGTWYASPNRGESFYVMGNTPLSGGKSKKILLHRLVMNAPQGLLVDHINHDTLDNRKSSNLRIVTIAENNQNKIDFCKSNTQSGVRGVTWNKRSNSWEVRHKINNITKHLGCYKDIDVATDVIKKYRISYAQQGELGE